MFYFIAYGCCDCMCVCVTHACSAHGGQDYSCGSVETTGLLYGKPSLWSLVSQIITLQPCVPVTSLPLGPRFWVCWVSRPPSLGPRV